MNKAFSKILIVIIIVFIGTGFFAWWYFEVLQEKNVEIIFTKENSMWSIKEDGTDLRKIYENSFWRQISSMSFSPDSKKVAVVADNKLFIINSDLEGLQEIEIDGLNYTDVSKPIWFPDNNNILLVGKVGEMKKSDRDIYKYNFENQELTDLTRNDREDITPKLSPDGKKILFNSYDDGWGLYIMDTDGGNRKLLTGNKECYESSWSPDGTEIVVNCFRDGVEIFSYPDLKFKSHLTKSGSSAIDLQWAERGMIYFSWGGGIVHSINPDTKQENIVEYPTDGDLLSSWYVVILSGEDTIPTFKEAEETANWQTHRNEEYGFEVKYPSNFFTESSSYGIDFAEIQWRGQMVHYPFIGIEFIQTSLTPEQWANEKATGIDGIGQEFDPQKRAETIGNNQFIMFQTRGVSGANDNALIQGNGNILFNIYHHSSGMGEVQMDIYNQMLSTFRFLE